jgi:RNA polymerase sigma factor (sigma-70 family)
LFFKAAQKVCRISAGSFVILLNMVAEDQMLLGQFTREGSQDAFTALVKRHLNLVYSAAVRQVREPQLAEEVSQAVFIKLAQNAPRLAPDTLLSAWLYQVTRHTAVDVIRREASRRAREQIAFEMNSLNNSSTAWSDIEPHLDEAMESLEPADRSALLLRYFENKSLREVGDELGASEDAAQKRVTRAIDRLREHFSKRKISIGAPALAALLSANAIQAAPAGLVLTIAGSAATVATISAAASTSIALTMTTAQKAIIAAVLTVGAVTVGIQTHQTSNLRADLERQHAQTVGLSNQMQQLEKERDEARLQVAALIKESTAKNTAPADSLKLRGEVSQLRQEKRQLGATSGLSKVTANPETKRLMREQQKAGMNMIYKSFARDAGLKPDQAEKLNDILADHIMDNVDNVTLALREKMSAEEADRLFTANDSALATKIRELIGEEGLAKYQNYNKDILGNISAHQFKSMMTGDNAAKDKKAEQMAKILNDQARAILTAAGLPDDHQFIPTLNFRNIASADEGDKNIQLLDRVFNSALDPLSKVLDEQELAKFREFVGQAVTNNRAALSMNRTLMAPIAD